MSTGSFFVNGTVMDEAAWIANNKGLSIGSSFVVSGFGVTDGGSLNATVGLGVAMINGARINITTNTTQALADNDTNYVYLGETVTDNVTGTNPGSALLRAVVVTSGGSISSITHSRDVGIDPDTVQNDSRRNVLLIKPSDESTSSDTTTSMDSYLSYDVIDGEVWDFTFILQVQQASAAAGFKLNPGSVAGTGSYYVVGGSVVRPTHGKFETVLAQTTSLEMDSAVTNNPVFMRGQIAATASGAFGLRWAQAVSTGSNTTVSSASIMIMRRLSG